MLRWMGMVVAGVLATALVVAAGALWWVETPGGHAVVRRIALAQAQRILPGLEVAAVGGDYFTGLELRGVVLRDGDGIVASLPRVTLRYSLLALLQLHLRVARVELVQPEVHLRAGPDGVLNLVHAVRVPPPAAASAQAGAPSRFQITIDEVCVTGGEFDVAGWAAREIAVSGRFHWDTDKIIAHAESLALDTELGSQPAHLRLSGGGELTGDAINLQLRAEVGRLLAEPVWLEASAVGARSRFPFSVTLRTAHSGNAALDGELGLTPLGYDIYGRVDRLALGVLFPELRGSQVSLRLALQGEGIPLAGDGSAHAVVSVGSALVGGVTSAAGSFSASATRQAWRVEDLEASTHGAWIFAQASGAGAQVEARVRALLSGETRLPPPLDVFSGRGTVLLQARGQLPHALTVRASGLLHQVALATFTAETVALEGNARDLPAHPVGTLALHARGIAEQTQGALLAALDADLLASRDAADVTVTAHPDPSRTRSAAIAPIRIAAHVPLVSTGRVLALAPRGGVQAQVRCASFPLALVNSFASRRIFDLGVGDIDATISGSILVPLVDATVHVANASVSGMRHVDARLALQSDATSSQLSLSARLAGKRAFEASAHLSAGVRRLSQPAIFARVPLTMRVQLAETEMRELGELIPERLGGQVAATLTLSGSAGAPQGELEVAWKHALAGSYRLGEVSGGALIATAPDASGKPAATRLNASVEVSGRRLLDAVATAPGTTRRWLQEKNPPPIELSARIPDFAPFGTASLTADYAPGNQASAHFSAQQAKGGTITADAGWRSGALTATLHADKFDLAFLSNGFWNARAIAGTLVADLSLQGQLGALALNGTASLKNATFGMGWMPTLKAIDIDARVTPEHVVLQIHQMKAGTGTLSGVVAANFIGVWPTSLAAAVKTSGFQLGFTGLTDATLDATITSEIAIAQTISGTVSVTDGVLHVPKLERGSALRSVARPGDIVFINQPHELAKLQGEALGTPVDIHIAVSPLFVRGKEVDAEVASRLELKVDTAGKIAPRGDVMLQHGTITLFDRRYDVREGEMHFSGDAEINPSLKLRLVHQFSDVSVTIGLQGTVRNPDLVLISDPPVYDRAQIISLVINGQASVNDASSPDAKNTLTNALIGAALGSFAGQIAPKIGLDVLRINFGGPKTDMSNPAALAAANRADPNATQARIEVGKYIARGLYVSYDRVFGAQDGQNANEAKLEYRVTPRLTVQSSFGDAAVGGLDLQWTYRY